MEEEFVVSCNESFENQLKVLPLLSTDAPSDFQNQHEDHTVYISNEVLEKGDFNSVSFKGLYKNKQVCVRRIPGVFQQRKKIIEDIASLLEIGQHENILIHFYGAFQENRVLLITDYWEVSLHYCVKEKKLPLSAQEIIRQATFGIKYLHESSIVHGNLKPESILIVSSKSIVKLSNFGLPSLYSHLYQNFIENGVLIGVIDWMAPEILECFKKQDYKVVQSSKSDIFSLGCVFYCTITKGLHPFGDVLERFRNMTHGHPIHDEKTTSLSPQDSIALPMVSSMISANIIERPSASETLKHPYFWKMEQTVSFVKKLLKLLSENNQMRSQVRQLESVLGQQQREGGWLEDVDEKLVNYLIKSGTSKNLKTLEGFLHCFDHVIQAFETLPDELQDILGKSTENGVAYLNSRFPFCITCLWYMFPQLMQANTDKMPDSCARRAPKFLRDKYPELEAIINGANLSTELFIQRARYEHRISIEQQLVALKKQANEQAAVRLHVSNTGQVKLLIKQGKYWLANKTKVSEHFLDILVNHRILTDEGANRMRKLKSTTGNEAAAYEIYKKLENWTDENAFENVIDFLKTEESETLSKLLEDDTASQKKSKACEGLGSLIKMNKDLRGEKKRIEETRQEKVAVTPKQVTNSNIFYHFHPSHRIGSGGEGSMVFGGFVKIGKREIPAAVKIIDAKDTRLVHSELEVWGRLKEEESSPTINIASLLEWKEEGGEIYFATELAERNFYDEITEHVNPFLDKRKIIDYLSNVGEAIQWLHDREFIHGRIKPENVLIYKYKDKSVPKLSVFGASEGLHSASRSAEEWMSPEQLSASEEPIKFKNTKMVDIFAFGMLCYFGLTGGEHPFMDGKGVFKKHILDMEKKPRELECRDLMTQEHLLHWMMQKKEEMRPTIKQVLRHPFFWTEKEVLNFIKAVVSGFGMENPSQWKVIREKIDAAFITYYRRVHNDQLFNWFLLIDERLIKIKSRAREIRYNKESFISFLKLVRDKYVHSRDMLDDLYQTFVDADLGAFSEEKYLKYFLKILPEMIIILFTALANIALQYEECMYTMSKYCLAEFVDCQHCWSDPTVHTFFENF